MGSCEWKGGERLKNTITLTDVYGYSEQLSLAGMEVMRWHNWLMVSLVIGLLVYMLATKFFGFEGDDEFTYVENLMPRLYFTLFAIFFLSFLNPSEEEREAKYIEHYDEWVKEYVNPYIETLPLEQLDLVYASYDTDLAEVNNSPRNGLLPIKVTDKEGNTFSFWGEVVVQEMFNPPFLTYQQLKEPVHFGKGKADIFPQPPIEVGRKNMVLYTGDTAFNDYLAEQAAEELKAEAKLY